MCAYNFSVSEWALIFNHYLSCISFDMNQQNYIIYTWTVLFQVSILKWKVMLRAPVCSFYIRATSLNYDIYCSLLFHHIMYGGLPIHRLLSPEKVSINSNNFENFPLKLRIAWRSMLSCVITPLPLSPTFLAGDTVVALVIVELY